MAMFWLRLYLAEVLLGPRVEQFAIFVKVFIAISFKMLRILTENTDSISCLESEIFLALYVPLEFLIFS